jgi:hypothetical protein
MGKEKKFSHQIPDIIQFLNFVSQPEFSCGYLRWPLHPFPLFNLIFRSGSFFLCN